MADKKSFILYTDEWESIEELSIEQRGVLFTAIYAVNNDDVELPEMDQPTRIVFKAIRRQLMRDAQKYDETLEKRRSAGSLGGKASAESRRSKCSENTTKSKQAKQVLQNTPKNEANEADNVNVNVNDNDNVNVSVNDNVGASHPDSEDTHTISDVKLYGTLHNVELTPEQYRGILNQYQNARKLINKVSVWLPEALHPVNDHFALVHRFAINDDWPKKPKQEKPPDESELDPERGPVIPMPDNVRKKKEELYGG